jgi:RES domain-containing protein
VTPLPAPLGDEKYLVAWRIDATQFAAAWDSGVGAEIAGGRWNPQGMKAVYASLDPSTSIVEVAVHRGFKVLDTKPHVQTSFHVLESQDIRVLRIEEIPNPAWLHGGVPSAGQQNFGAKLLQENLFIVVPSVVSRLSWNLVFNPSRATGKYKLRSQDRLVLDTRLNPSR